MRVGGWGPDIVLFGFLPRVVWWGKGRGLGIELGVGEGVRSFTGGCSM